MLGAHGAAVSRQSLSFRPIIFFKFFFYCIVRHSVSVDNTGMVKECARLVRNANRISGNILQNEVYCGFLSSYSFNRACAPRQAFFVY